MILCVVRWRIAWELREVHRTHGDAVGRRWKLRAVRKCSRIALDAALADKAEMEVLTEDCSGRIVTGETGLAHTRTVNCQLKLISSLPPRALLWTGSSRLG